MKTYFLRYIDVGDKKWSRTYTICHQRHYVLNFESHTWVWGKLNVLYWPVPLLFSMLPSTKIIMSFLSKRICCITFESFPLSLITLSPLVICNLLSLQVTIEFSFKLIDFGVPSFLEFVYHLNSNGTTVKYRLCQLNPFARLCRIPALSSSVTNILCNSFAEDKLTTC